MIRVGADPEMFLKKAGNYLSAYGLIPGDKINPHLVPFGAVQVDGMAVEFNIDPADSRESFCHNIKAVMAQLREMLPDYEVVADSVATFDDDYLKQQPDAALDLGCDPDYNGWTMQENKKPDYRLSFRTGAGHVHVGIGHFKFDDKHLHMCSSLVKQLDFYLGLPSVVLDTDNRRRQMYGQAGAFRPKPYGLEYRVLSNFWLNHDRLTEWVFDNTTAAVMSMKDGPLVDEFGDIQEIINRSLTDEAREIIALANIPMPKRDYA